MKSYYSHLQSTLEFGEKKLITKKPILRSSGVFPVIHNQNFSTSIHFLGYWLLKRQIPEVTLTITLRDEYGKTLLRKIEIINEPKVFSINLDSILKEIQLYEDFLGSIEIEFNTTRDMVFPFPALVLEYYNKFFNTCVHTLGRIYNDFEDLQQNDEFKVPETGFDIHETNDLHSFLSFVNGPISNDDGIIEYEVTNSDSEKLNGKFHLGKMNQFETKFIEFGKIIPELSNFLKNNFGSISIKHNFEGFYPRFLVGTKQNSFPSVSFTHSYYDCSSCTTETDFWNRTIDTHYDSSVYIPIFTKNNEYTNLIIYPNFSPSNFSVSLQLFDKSGNKVQELPKFLDVKSNESKLHKIDFNKIIESFDQYHEITSAYVVSHFATEKIPARIKFGLDVGISDSQSKLPCNICFNSKMGNPLIENKPGSFHWAPLLPNRNSIITLGNFSTLKNYDRSAKIEMIFYRKEDLSTISKTFTLGPNCETRISSVDDDIKNFLKSEGWVTIKADNPYIQGFYFNFNSSGSVAGDHVF